MACVYNARPCEMMLVRPFQNGHAFPLRRLGDRPALWQGSGIVVLVHIRLC